MADAENEIVEFGWEPGASGRFYILTGPRRRKHIVPDEMRLSLSAHRIDLGADYPFIDDAEGVAIKPKVN